MNTRVITATGLCLTLAGSPDRKKFAFFTQADPTAPLFDLSLVDTAGGQPPVQVDAQVRNARGGTVFTADSEHILFARDINLTTGTATIFTAQGSVVRQISDNSGLSWQRATTSLISFNDNVAPHPTLPVSTADLKVVDLSTQTLAPRTIATQANPTYFASADGRLVIFTTDAPGTTAGLYVARAED